MKNQEAISWRRISILVIVIVVLLLGSILSLGIIRNKSQKSSAYACIYRDNELIEQIDLRQVTEPYQLTFSYGEDDYNVVEVKEGSIGMVESTCPDHLCEEMGFIDQAYMPITCLPHHLVIRVTNEKAEQLDAVSY